MARCALAALLGQGGPVRVSVRPCCLVALVGRPGAGPPTDPDGRDSFVCDADRSRLVEVPAGAGEEP